MLSSHIDDSGRMDLSSKPNGDSNNQSLRSGNDNLSQGRVDVNSLLGGFDEFYFSWKEQEEYFFYLHFSLVGKETGYPCMMLKVGQIAAESFQLASTNQKFVDLPGISNVGSPIDLQIATWLLWPDEESAQSFSLEQVPLLAELESFGIRVDMEGCKQARQQVESKIKELEGRAQKLAGVLF
ncbi:hypothetical protein L7F22_032390 [Adiantum nelumboides]|nr:hypothetical protein [Adiantum nelumboides]